MKTTTANTPSNHNSLTTAARRNRSGFSLRRRNQGEAKRFCLSLAVCLFASILSVGVAYAGEVTVSYQTFPSGPVLDTNVISAGCDTATAQTFPDYEFLFWDNNGTISFTPTVSICAQSTNTIATAWYVETGCSGPCNCPQAGCFVTTFAFSIDHDKVLTDGTPIELVSPNSPLAWTSPSTTVLTNSPESISAKSSLAFPPYAAEPFRFWQELGTSTETPIGVVYQAGKNDTAWVVAFYGPDPCQTLRNEFQSCMYGDGPHGPLNCAPIGKALIMCEKLNRETQ